MKNTLPLFLTLLLLGYQTATTKAGALSWGSCPSPALEAAFVASTYTGVWYEIRRLGNEQWQTGNCTTAQYQLNSDGSIRVLNAQTMPLTGLRTTINGKATCDGA